MRSTARGYGASHSSIVLSGSGAHAVETPLPVDAHVDEARVAEHAEMLRHRGLADRQRGNEIADGLLAGEQQVEDPAPVGFGNHLEELHCCHDRDITL